MSRRPSGCSATAAVVRVGALHDAGAGRAPEIVEFDGFVCDWWLSCDVSVGL